MSIRVKFFASLREKIGRDEARLESAAPLTVADVWTKVCENAAQPPNMLMAVNMNYVDNSALVRDGDEVAFFPPVTGG
ncbi:MAG: molybdopterin converting factor subunit 1 [Gammaproteobacteria bacterium]|nr:molybdopterin converting factor subunit 1 [Gammaproteobacteria bacterium]